MSRRRARRSTGRRLVPVQRVRRAVNDLAYLSIGTGIAAGYVERGQLRRGNSLVAGEIGHIPIDPQGPRARAVRSVASRRSHRGSAIERLCRPRRVRRQRSCTAPPSAATGCAPLWTGVVGGLSRPCCVLVLTWDPEVVVLVVAWRRSAARCATRSPNDSQAMPSTPVLGSLDIAARMRVIDPSVPLGPIGAVRAAYAARPVLLP